VTSETTLPNLAPEEFPALMSALGALGEAQLRAVMSDAAVLAVIAGAGTGKTRVLTLRVARRIADETAQANHIEVVTFSRKAADELRTRLWRLGCGEVSAGTFHRRALSLLRQYRADRHLAPPVVLTDRRAALSSVMSETGSRPSPASVARVEAEISWAKARLVAPSDYVMAVAKAARKAPLAPAAVADLYQSYELRKARRGVLDLDDLLWEAAELIEGDPRTAEVVRWRIRHLFVDECQDMNPAQYRLLRALLGSNPDLFVVGDPNQSVYGWNGAEPDLIERIVSDFPGAETISLLENHRCSPEVVAVASAALGIDEGRQIPTRLSGALPRLFVAENDSDEAHQIANLLYQAHRAPRRWSHLAVLTRTNAQLKIIAEVLKEKKIPYRLAEAGFAPASDLNDERAGDDEETTTLIAPNPSNSDDESEVDENDCVTLTTFHRSKGLEWPVVIVAGLHEGMVPHRSAKGELAINEERRTLYVALTRAIDELIVTRALRSDSSSTSRSASPWWKEIERAREELLAQREPPDPSLVRQRIAALRSLVKDETSK